MECNNVLLQIWSCFIADFHRFSLFFDRYHLLFQISIVSILTFK